MIRQTWKNHLEAESEKIGHALIVAAFGFILELTMNNSTQTKMKEKRATKYGDIIQKWLVSSIGCKKWLQSLFSPQRGWRRLR